MMMMTQFIVHVINIFGFLKLSLSTEYRFLNALTGKKRDMFEQKFSWLGKMHFLRTSLKFAHLKN